MRDTLDASHAWIEVGTVEGPGWLVRTGRQELSFGDERLIGADSEWSPVTTTFDALRAELRSQSASLNVFTAAPVEVEDGRWNRHSGNQRLHGVYGSLRVGRHLVEPYALRATDASETARRDTFGIHLRGQAGDGYDHNLEFAIQRGHEAKYRIGAWSAHLELGKTLRAIEGVRLSAEYNYASGDANPTDARTGGFDDLYAAAYNKYGIADPFAARNIQNVEFSADWQTTTRLGLSTGYRSYWVATRADYIYPSSADPHPVARGAGAHIADQVHGSAVYRTSERWKFTAGLGCFVRRAPSLAAGLLARNSTGYLGLTRSF